MTGSQGEQTESIRFRAEPVDLRLDHDLGLMSLIYHRRSGITHMVSEPVPQILEALDVLGLADAGALARHLLGSFDVQADDGDGAEAEVARVVAARLDELAMLGLVIREGG